ncbi:MAG TPA: inositol monophosphatase [Jatrophihabitantaceae bacterium]|nr:inositol monophosphatase [Jatrophihabitantaceae bacterium]
MTAEWLALAEELARWAIEHVGPARRHAVDTKTGPADLVTDADREIERHVRDTVLRRFPEHRVVGEEFGGTSDGRPTWYVDPIDGTTNFARGIPWFSFSVGIVADGRLVGGVVADLARGEVVSARAGHGATADGAPVRCADVTGLAGEVVLTEWSRSRPWPGMIAMLARLVQHDCTTRIMGSSALSLATVASGRAAAAVLGRYNSWDVLGGIAAAREAGAVVLSRHGPIDAALPPTDGLLVAAPGVAGAVRRAWLAPEA